MGVASPWAEEDIENIILSVSSHFSIQKFQQMRKTSKTFFKELLTRRK